MLRPHGYVTIVDPGASGVARVTEYDSVTCGHCSRVIFVKPGTISRVYLFPQLDGTVKEEPGAGCLKCAQPVCLRCHQVGTCRPVEKWMDQLEQAGRRRL